MTDFPTKTLREFELEQEVARLKHELYRANAIDALRPKIEWPVEKIPRVHRISEPLQVYLQSSCGVQRTDLGWELRAMSHNGDPNRQLHFMTMMDHEAIHKIHEADLPYYLCKKYEQCLSTMHDWLLKARRGNVAA